MPHLPLYLHYVLCFLPPTFVQARDQNERSCIALASSPFPHLFDVHLKPNRASAFHTTQRNNSFEEEASNNELQEEQEAGYNPTTDLFKGQLQLLAYSLV